jgi:ssDNA-binding Zn-finger/Zn-ribbon topoisomerase 1
MKHISVELNEGQLREITKQARKEGEADYRFDVNLMEGKLSENKWADLLETIEFKKDYKAWKTGNIAVEYKMNGEPSGIAKTEAKYVAYVLVDEQQNENIAIFLKTNIIRDMCRKYLGDSKRDIKGGDNNKSSLILLPIDELLNPLHIFGIKKKEPDVVYGQQGEDKLTWNYVCPECNYTYESDSKNLYKTCPNCWETGDKVRMAIQ